MDLHRLEIRLIFYEKFGSNLRKIGASFGKFSGQNSPLKRCGRKIDEV